MKKLSIIVPVYNMAAGGRLAFCLDSLVNQTLPHDDYEIIAIDDCSTDASADILRDYAARHPSFFTMRRSLKNLRQGGAKNLGLSLATGRWIGFVDSDDFVAPDFYEKLLSLAEKEGTDLAGCDLYRTHTRAFTPGYSVVHCNRASQRGTLDEEKKRSLILDGGFLPPKIFRRHLILGDDDRLQTSGKQNRADVFPEEMFYEDNAAGPFFFLRATGFSYLEEPLYYYVQEEASTTQTVTRGRLHDRMRAANLMLEKAEREGLFTRFRDEFVYRYTHLFYINTLFSAMQAKHLPGCYSLTKQLGTDMARRFPEFQKNPYYLTRTPAEEQKLIQMQMQSHGAFYAYYRALWLLRNVRTKKGKADDGSAK